MLYDERAKNNDATAHMVLDKCIYELHTVLDMINSKTPLLHQAKPWNGSRYALKLEEDAKIFATRKVLLACTVATL